MRRNKSPFMRNLGRYRQPEIGEKIPTRHGMAEVRRIIHYDEVVEEMERNRVPKEEIDHFTLRAEHFLNHRKRYFECFIRYEDGEYDYIDWSEYLVSRKKGKSLCDGNGGL